MKITFKVRKKPVFTRGDLVKIPLQAFQKLHWWPISQVNM
jgi:hypothetical protein